MKVFIEDGCIACGLCVSTCDEVFDFGEDGFACVKENPNEENEDIVRQAAESCPVEVIKIEE